LSLSATEKPEFSRDVTECLKGIFLVLMFIHHFFQFPNSYIAGISYPELKGFENYQGHFQICVAGFAFLTGYFYAFSKRQNLEYSIRKILGLYIGYWTVLFFMTGVAVFSGTFSLSLGDFMLEVLAVRYRLLCFCWYVLFYLMAMLYLPLIVAVAGNRLHLWLLLGVVVPFIAYMALGKYIGPLEKFQVYFPIMTGGVLCGKYAVFGRMDSLIDKCGRRYAWFFIFASVGGVLAVFFEPGWLYLGPQHLVLTIVRKIIRIASIPVFVYALSRLIRSVKPEVILIPLRSVGRYSMLLWFLHGGFFNISKTVTQPLLFWPHHPLFVTLWGVFICLVIAYVLDRPVRWATAMCFSRFKMPESK